MTNVDFRSVSLSVALIVFNRHWQLTVGSDTTAPSAITGCMYVALFPVSIWIYEVVLDWLYLGLFHRNVAWCY